MNYKVLSVNEFYSEYKKELDSFHSQFRYLNLSYDDNNIYYLCLYDNNIPVGITKLKLGGNYSIRFNKYNNWISFVSVSNRYRGKGYSRILVESIFDYCSKNGITSLLQSDYSVMGWERIKKYFVEYSKKYPQIDFHDTDNHDLYDLEESA